jgi:MYXO-CTERM domain-containing protein
MARPGLILWSTASLMLAAAVTPALAASGDTCADATAIASLPFSKSGTTCGAGDDFSNVANGTAVCTDLPKDYGGDDVFFNLVLEKGNQVAFDLTMPPGATGDLALFLVRAPSCGDPLVCAGNSVDLIGAGVGPERIKANLQAYPAGTYYLIVDSKLAAPDPASCGAYALTVTGHLSAFCGNGTVDPGEVCDDGNASDGDCCSADCQNKAAAGTVCRASAGACDIAETCNADGTCPSANAVKPSGTACRPVAGKCDTAEVCDGVTAGCGADRFLSAGTVCRAALGICDRTETCTGTGPACPADAFQAPGTSCGAPTTCQMAPSCNGSGACVPGGPVSCEDNNSCTVDSCNPFFGCLHANMCQDGGVDAAGDGSRDTAAPDGLAPDVSRPPADMAASDVDRTLVPDAPLPARDAAPPIDTTVDSPGADVTSVPQDGAPPPEAGIAFDGSALPRDGLGSILDSGSAKGELDGAPGSAPDSGPTSPQTLGDGGEMQFLPTKSGCSCALGAGDRSTEGTPAALLAVALIALVALRRRAS